LPAEAPRVSAIIPTYNYARYAAAAVESALSQSFKDLEIVVVDDGSTDETAETLRPFGRCIRYIRQAHRGLAAARNMGIRVSRGRYLAFLDSDDLWLPDKTSMQIAQLDPNPAVGLVYCEAALFTEASPTEIPHSYWAHHPSGRILPSLLRHNVVPSPTPMVRREMFDQVGLFDESLGACEDWDMWIRIAQVSEFGYVDRVLAKYRLHSANMSLDHERMMRNRFRVLEKAFAAAGVSAEARRLRRSIVSRWHADYALHHFYAERYEQARREVIRAVVLDPRCLSYGQTAAVLLSCLFGSATAATLRRVKRAIKRTTSRPKARRAAVQRRDSELDLRSRW
jgi:teichuronic acid biosynthesis glycosyltransferase TuaG